MDRVNRRPTMAVVSMHTTRPGNGHVLLMSGWQR
jgi:hypothetical protein